MRDLDKKKAKKNKNGKGKWSWFSGGFPGHLKRKSKPVKGYIEKHVCLNWTHLVILFIVF